MATVRLQIVAAVAAALDAALAIPVYRNLDYAISEGSLPALAVQSVDDATSEGRLNALEQEMQLDIVVLVSGSADPEAAVDPYEAAAHAVLYGAATFGGHPVVVRRIGAAWQFDLGDSAQRSLRYGIAYASAVADLEAAA